MKFAEFLNEIKETNAGDGDFGYDSIEGRQYEFEQFKEDGKKVGNIKGQPIYMKKESGGMAFAVLDEESEVIDFISRISVDEEIDDIQGYSQSGVWKDKDSKFNATDVIDIILNEIKLLISDRYQTKDGKKLWKNIFMYKGKYHSCGVYNPKSKEIIYFKDIEEKTLSDKVDTIMKAGYEHKDLVFFIYK